VSIAEGSFPLTSASQLSTKSISSWQSRTNASEILSRHIATPESGNTTTARVVGEADESAILVDIEEARVWQAADTAFVSGKIGPEKSGSLGLGNGGVDVAAVLPLSAVVSVALRE
jgi:hypothetical protein